MNLTVNAQVGVAYGRPHNEHLHARSFRLRIQSPSIFAAWFVVVMATYYKDRLPHATITLSNGMNRPRLGLLGSKTTTR